MGRVAIGLCGLFEMTKSGDVQPLSPAFVSGIEHVLFVCTHDRGRSQMAQAFFEHYAPDDIRAEAAGHEPAAHTWPAVVEAMAEVKVDIAERRP